MKISDSMGHELFVIPTIPKFTKPVLIYDILSEKDVKPDIQTYSDIAILDKINFVLYSKPIPKKLAFAKKQRFIFYLRPAELQIGDESLKKLKKLPANHFLELDVANQKIKLIGPFSERGVEWMDY